MADPALRTEEAIIARLADVEAEIANLRADLQTIADVIQNRMDQRAAKSERLGALEQRAKELRRLLGQPEEP